MSLNQPQRQAGHTGRFRVWIAIVALQISLSASAFAQEANHTDSATLPSTGVLLARQQFQFSQYQGASNTSERQINEYTALTCLSYGVANGAALTLDAPLSYREINGRIHSPPSAHSDMADDHGSDFGFGDLTLGFKLRLFNHDFGPVDTARLVVITAIETPTGDDAFSSDSWDPIIGGAFTYIHDHHGFDVDLKWKFNNGAHAHPTHGGMGPSDALFYNLAYLYRVMPARYSQSSYNATYLLIEANGTYETNGDNEILFSPGIMYEAKNFALELSVQIPALQNVAHRPETRFTVMLGIRILF